MDEDRAPHDRAERVRDLSHNVGDAAATMASAEARLVETTGEFAGAATRAMSGATARGIERRGLGSADMVEIAGDALARAVEAGAGLASTMLEAGGTWAQELAEGAGDATAAAMERRPGRTTRHQDDDPAAAIVAPPPVPGPS